MDVRVGEAREEEAAGRVDDRGLAVGLECACGSDSGDAGVLDEDRDARPRVRAGAVDERGVVYEEGGHAVRLRA